MLFVFYGTNAEMLRKKSTQLISGLLKKRPDAAHISLTAESFNSSVIEELSGGQALFGGTYIAELTRTFEHPDASPSILSFAKELAESSNIIIIREPALAAKEEKILGKHAHTIAKFDTPVGKAVERFNAFQLGDALYARNRKELWVLLQKARLSGLSDEELLGSLWYSVKALVASGIEANAADAGLKPYPFQKAKAAGRNYSKEEQEQLFDGLFQVQRDLRAGEGELSHLLERWVLSV